MSPLVLLFEPWCVSKKNHNNPNLRAAERANSLACALGSLPETEGLADGLPDDDMTFGARL